VSGEEREIGRAERQYRLLAELCPDAILVSAGGHFVYANAAAARLLGAAHPGEIVGRSPFDVVDPRYHDLTRQLIRQVLERQRTVPLIEYRWLRLNGSGVDVEVAAGPIEWDGRPAVQAVVRDVTERHRVAEALRRAAAADAFRVVLGDALRPLTDATEIEAVAARVLGHHLGATRVHYAEVTEDGEYGIVRADYHDGVPSVVGRHRFDDYGPTVMGEFRAGRNLVVGDVANDPRLTPAERAATAELTIGAYVIVPLIKGRRPVAVLVVHNAVPCAWTREEVKVIEETAERTWEAVQRGQAEIAMRAAKEAAEQANEVKSRFLSTMSHELRTPLTAVIGFADIMAGEVIGPVNPAQKKNLGRIRASAWHLVSIIDEILAFSRSETGREEVRPITVDVAGIVRDVTAMLTGQTEDRDLELETAGAEGEVIALTDGGKVRQILVNLVGNAIRYTDRGTITVELEASPDDFVMRVRDTGPGIPSDRLEDIFEPFVQVDESTTRARGGTGLGLAICRRLARLLGGEVTVESAVGRGSTFTARLPRRVPGGEGKVESTVGRGSS